MRTLTTIMMLALLSMSALATDASDCSVTSQNNYTITSTYQKYIKRFPFITIANTSHVKNIKITRNVRYKSAPIFQCERASLQPLTLDIYQPAQQQKLLPLITLVHGGGWSSGKPSILKALAMSLAQNGYVVATPSYRLSHQAKYPSAIVDVADAIHWLKEHHEALLIDTKNLYIAGTSAGGQIAALLAYTQGYPEHNPRNKNQLHFNALINIDGLSDFTSPKALPFENDQKKKNTSASAWLGGKYEEIPDIWRQASPVNHVDTFSPATLFIIGGKARFSAGFEEVIEKLSSNQIYSKTYQFKQAPHSFWLFNPWLDETVTIITDFLAKQKQHIREQ